MRLGQYSSFRDLYISVCNKVLDYGEPVSPRGQQTKEVIGASFELTRPEYSLPISIGRKPNVAIGYAEALQLIAGQSYPDLMSSITGVFKRFQDGGVLHGAYGLRIREQLPFLLRRLATEPGTRQAVMTLWDPQRDLQFLGGTPRDLPCTSLMQFMIRQGRLHMHVTMRSNDVWLGMAYDVHQFTALQRVLARILGVELGHYYHTANSLHAYERDWDKIRELRSTALPEQTAPIVGRKHMLLQQVQDRAESLLKLDLPFDATDEEHLIHSTLVEATR